MRQYRFLSALGGREMAPEPPSCTPRSVPPSASMFAVPVASASSPVPATFAVTAEHTDRLNAQAETTAEGGGLKGLVRGLKDEAEMEAIARALEQTNWNRKKAAALLQISYKALLYKIRQYDLQRVPSNSVS